uniref:Uncharacterized protein n=1 Tax=Anguilla anguilla TaxID=7936 RepID=A0A0E9URT8_ANGAN
MKQGRTGKAE